MAMATLCHAWRTERRAFGWQGPSKKSTCGLGYTSPICAPDPAPRTAGPTPIGTPGRARAPTTTVRQTPPAPRSPKQAKLLQSISRDPHL